MADTTDTCVAEVKPAGQAVTEVVSKLGGAPVFLESAEIPRCADCGQEMALIAQLRLDGPLPQSCNYSMAYVFMCLCTGPDGQFTGCETWDPTSGANAVLLQKLTDNTRAPKEQAQLPDYLIEWRHYEEPKVDTSKLGEIEEADWDLISPDTKLGGIPKWVQFEEIPSCPQCGGTTHYIAQIAELNDQETGVALIVFGDAGKGYVFICDRECSARGAAFLWQCA